MKKKNNHKLVIRSETLRALGNAELARAIGGSAALLRESGATCPAPAVIIPPPGG